MTFFRKQDLAATLEGERPMLDRIFGPETYKIASDAHDLVTVGSSLFSARFMYESRRDRSVSSELSVAGSREGLTGTHLWLRFLGEQIPATLKDGAGRVTISIEEQVREELKRVLRIVESIFSDAQKTRDAAHFIKGYEQAYNDWASADGSWSVA